jgi:cytochrome c-type biogenesis protein CcmE
VAGRAPSNFSSWARNVPDLFRSGTSQVIEGQTRQGDLESQNIIDRDFTNRDVAGQEMKLEAPELCLAKRRRDSD